MVHHLPQTERSPRKRDRRTAGLPPYGSQVPGETNVGEQLSLLSVPGTGGPLGEIQPPPPKIGRMSMYDTYQPWVLQTYGDQAKTKTITRNKYQRILQILRGDYIDNESSKFKLWVKGRGFRIGPPPGYYHPTLMDPNIVTIGQSTIDYNPDKDPCPDIYVQTGTIKDAEGNDRICFKKVAIVEDFFEIVYNLHVCRDGKELKHMGQKRTYRAVSERYAFVPREAVTKFLVLCTECPRRSSGVPASLNNLNNKNIKNNKNVKASTSINVTPPSITTSLSSYTNHLGTPLLRSPLLRVTHASNHPAMILNSSQPKRKNNFSSVVSLVGNNDENGSDASSPHSIHIGRNGTFTFAPTTEAMSIFQHHHHTFGDKRIGLSFEDVQMTPLRHPTSILQPLPTSLSTTPPPTLAPASPPKVIKSEPFAMPLTPETPHESTKTQVEVLPLNLNLKEEKEPEEAPLMYREEEPVDYSEQLSALSTEVDFTLPITTLYMKHIKNKKKEPLSHYDRFFNMFRDGPKMAESEGSEDEHKTVGSDKRFESRSTCEWTPYPSSAQQQDQPLSLSKSDAQRRSPCGSPGTNERTGSGTPLGENISNAEETSSNGNKDEDDDDNDDDNEDEKMDAQYDPERLKAFNMFVRLFVDENLDRIVPISKQPKEKIQAIIDACARQFPEFADRTRKRIRTYLKSCRRNKRTRDSNGWENSRPTPPHLTSIQAEQILATACENEAQNAKRMRLGLEPVSQPNPLAPQPTVTQSHMTSDKAMSIVETSVSKMDSSGIPTSTSHSSALAKALERPLGGGDSKVMNGSNIFQTSFHNNYQKVSNLPGGAVAHQQQGVAMLLPSSGNSTVTSSPAGSVSSGNLPNSSSVQMVANGPTDLSLKGTAAKANPRPSLNAVEVAAVRQLITGYRESAAFLLRSADELENLLVHQQNP